MLPLSNNQMSFTKRLDVMKNTSKEQRAGSALPPPGKNHLPAAVMTKQFPNPSRTQKQTTRPLTAAPSAIKNPAPRAGPCPHRPVRAAGPRARPGPLRHRAARPARWEDSPSVEGVGREAVLQGSPLRAEPRQHPGGGGGGQHPPGTQHPAPAPQRCRLTAKWRPQPPEARPRGVTAALTQDGGGGGGAEEVSRSGRAGRGAQLGPAGAGRRRRRARQVPGGAPRAPPRVPHPSSEPPRDAVLGAGRGSRAGRDEAVMAAGPGG